jgi:hypothetical protein
MASLLSKFKSANLEYSLNGLLGPGEVRLLALLWNITNDYFYLRLMAFVNWDISLRSIREKALATLSRAASTRSIGGSEPSVSLLIATSRPFWGSGTILAARCDKLGSLCNRFLTILTTESKRNGFATYRNIRDCNRREIMSWRS